MTASRMRNAVRRVAWTLLIIAAPPTIHGAEAPPCSDYDDARAALCERSMKVAASDFAVPEAPAFAILGVAPSNVVAPGNTNEFALSLLNAVDENGTLQTGVAYDFSPYMTFVGHRVTLADYQRSPAVRLLTNTRVSFAATRAGDDEDEAGRLGLGVRLSPWVLNDRRLDAEFNRCLGEQISSALGAEPPPPPLAPGADQAAIDAQQSAWQKRILERFSTDSCEATGGQEGGFLIGAAKAWQGEGEGFGDLRNGQTSVWGTLGFPLELDRIPGFTKPVRFAVQAQYDDGELVIPNAAAGTTVRQDVLTSSASLALPEFDLGPLSRFSLSAEFRYVDAEREAMTPDEDFRVFVLDGRFRLIELSETVWLKFSFGKTSGRTDGDDTFGGLSIGWGGNERSLRAF